MAKITITFHEEGQPPSVIEIPAPIADALGRHVDYLRSEGQPIAGKTDLFVFMTWHNWLKPVLERQGVSVRQLAGDAGTLVEELEAQLEQAKAAQEVAAINAVVQKIDVKRNFPSNDPDVA